MDNQLISAKVIAYTESPFGDKLITIETTSPKFLDAEVEKHRMLSTNSSSSRAIPFKRTLDADIFFPYDIRKDEKGMQGYETLDEIDLLTFQAIAFEMYDFTVGRVKDMKDLFNVHKQHLNRYMEPWTVQRKVMTGNIEWFDYFIMLRSATDADPNIQDLSRKIDAAITSAKPTFSTWHMPYVTDMEKGLHSIKEQLIHSTARCARVSYNNFDGIKSSAEQDEKLFKFLFESRHLTPFEHQAKRMDEIQINPIEDFYTAISNVPKGVTHVDFGGYYYSGNFKGFLQHRQII